MMGIPARMNCERFHGIQNRNRGGAAWLIRLAVLVLLLPAGGCAALGRLPFVPGESKTPEATATDPVVEILCLWQPAEGRGVDGLPTRGFAGQILFFTRNSASPVKVNGDVRIYLFENRGSAADQAKPIHQFDFLGPVWNRHLQNGTLGPSYHVFVPYVKSHPWQTEGSLRVRLTPQVGAAVYSDLAKVKLPGAEEPGQPDDSVEAATGVVRQSLQRKAADQQTAELRKSMRTSSISMTAGSSAEARMTETRSGLAVAPVASQAETSPANAGLPASSTAAAIQETAARLQALQAQALLESQHSAAAVPAAGAIQQATVMPTLPPAAQAATSPAPFAGGIQQVSHVLESDQADTPQEMPAVTRSRRFQLQPAAGAAPGPAPAAATVPQHPLAGGQYSTDPRETGTAASPHPLAGLE